CRHPQLEHSPWDAVVRRSGGLHCLDRPNDNVPQKQSPQLNGKQSSSSFPRPSVNRHCFVPVSGHPHPPTPRPLFPLTTVIIGDSVTRGLRFHNAVTHCFPGAKVADILAKVVDLIPSFSTSIKRIVVHCGHNDMSTRIQECERTRRDFTTLIEALKSTGKLVFISGPLPSLGRGVLVGPLPPTRKEHDRWFSTAFRQDKSGVKLFTSNLFYFLCHPSVPSAKDKREQNNDKTMLKLVFKTKPDVLV
uniref:SGNH hydrolase-type esterase domain-containing protein n=1 Tax=Sander lucioperca TaxID=283035 RepID=A0A8C9YT64_SANLU